MILNDLWMGGMSIRRYLNWKVRETTNDHGHVSLICQVVASILFFPLVLRIEFKSAEELKLQPKTHEEHLATQNASNPDDEDDDDEDLDDSGEYHSEVTSNDFTHARLSIDGEAQKLSRSNNDTSIEFVLENQTAESECIEMITFSANTRCSLNRSASSISNLQNTFRTPSDDTNEIVLEIGKKIDEPAIPNHSFNRKASLPSTIPVSQRFYEFYNAPITKFWYNAIFYLVFLFLFTYMVLVRTPRRPSIAGRKHGEA